MDHLLSDERLDTEDLYEDATISLVPLHPSHHHHGAGLVVFQLPVNLLNRTLAITQETFEICSKPEKRSKIPSPCLKYLEEAVNPDVFG